MDARHDQKHLQFSASPRPCVEIQKTSKFALLLDVPVARQREADLRWLESGERCLRPPVADIRAEGESRHAGKRRLGTAERLKPHRFVDGIRETGGSDAQGRAID